MKHRYQAGLVSALCMLLFLVARICMTEARTQTKAGGKEGSDTGRWISTPDGQTLLHPFNNSPYPHESRAKGHVYDKTVYDAATHYNDSTVGIFIPADYHPSETVDYVVHFHGWSNHVAQVLDRYELRQQIAQSKCNAILIVPQGPKDAQDSGGGKLEHETGAFAALMKEITAFLVSEGKIHTARIGHIALSAHSGGYLVTGAILKHGGMEDAIRDVLLFDASYGELEAFADWAKRNSAHRLVSLFTEHLASANFQLLTLLRQRHVAFETILEPNLNETLLTPRRPLFIHTLDLPHDEVMQKRHYFTLFLRTSALASKTP